MWFHPRFTLVRFCLRPVVWEVNSPPAIGHDGGVIDHVVTSGQFLLDGGTWDVDNNVWIVGNATDCVVIDAAHDAEAIAARVGNRTVRAIVCTHAHNDHVNAAPALAALTGAPILLHPADRELWDQTHPDRAPDGPLTDGQTLVGGDADLTVLHTPGHAPGACCLYSPSLGVVFTGDTLFAGGPGATGRSFSSFETIIESIRERLLVLPRGTVVHAGHGVSTTIGAESPHLDEWIARGH
jgi:glyoxylase-like metal-dependent hydrolase (beta-lactamase superfamily II)